MGRAGRLANCLIGMRYGVMYYQPTSMPTLSPYYRTNIYKWVSHNAYGNDAREELYQCCSIVYAAWSQMYGQLRQLLYG